MQDPIHDQILKLFPPIDGTDHQIAAEASSPEGRYVIVRERGEDEGGEFLVFAPQGGEPVILMADTTVRPIDPRLAPETVRISLDTVEGDRAPARLEAGIDDLEELFEPIRQAFERLRSGLAENDRGPSRPAASGTNQRIHEAALRHVNTLSSRNVPGTDGGNLACAWAVNYVVKDAIGRPVGGGLSTVNMYDALVRGRGTRIDPDQAGPGSIIISPREGRMAGHVGIVGESQKVYSNSSRRALWVQNYTFTSWRSRYVEEKGLRMHFFNVNG